MATKQLKVLCLHGFCENKDYFSKKARGLQDALPYIDFHFISAPHRYKNKKRTFMWWNAVHIEDIDGMNTMMKCKNYEGMIDTLYYISDVIDSKGPFDGIIGFSQGGVLLSLILGLMQYPLFAFNELKLDSKRWNLKESNLKFGINISGFIPQDIKVAPLFEDIFYERRAKIITPLMYICGSQEAYSDKVKKLLPKYFEDYRDHTHDGGHIIPSDAATINTLNSFLDGFVQNTLTILSKL